MIDVSITKDLNGFMRSFVIKNHGSSPVCAAVSMLAINTANSIEMYTDDDFSCSYNEEGGFLTFCLRSENISPSADVLLKSLELGLITTKKKYPNEINLKGCGEND